jgi:predicted nucleic acid-binding protein
MIYLDTSYILKCYLNEPGTAAVLQLVQTNPGRASAAHARAEVWTGIHRHLRGGNLSSRHAQAVWRAFERDERQGLWHWLPIDAGVIRRACAASEHLPTNRSLRSSAALHLACAAENGFTDIYSNDKNLLGAARFFGIHPKNVISK